MYAMQYEISLPADYDMERIRHRVTARGRATDDFPGLDFKAYLIRERAAGAPRNQYAPFYVWSDVDGMSRFLWGGAGFGGLVADFGRPAVRHWTVAARLAGPAHGEPPTWAVRAIHSLAEDAVPDTAVPAAVAALAERVLPTTHTQVLAVDPATWELCEFTLLGDKPAAYTGSCYQVLHLSQPGRA